MASGLPIVTTNVGSAPDFVSHGENGILVPPANYEAIAEAILKLLSEDELRFRIKINNWLKAVNNYSWSIFARRLYNIY